MKVLTTVVTTIIILFTAFLLLSCSQSEKEQKKGDIIQAELVLIPGGEFSMGKDGGGNYNPAHKVYVDSFYIDKYEVTNAQYFKFCKETDGKLPEFWGMSEYHSGQDFPNHPVVGVNCGDARAYAKWAGKRLLTEAEWEYAARGGLAEMNYPNGDEFDTTQANYAVKGIMRGTVPVGSYPANGFGLYDMSGNVFEWVSDYYDEGYYKTSSYKNPTGPEKGTFRVIRGGGWHSGPYCNRVYYRNGLPTNWVDFAVGFRCGKDLR